MAHAQKEYEGEPFEITIEQMEPERLFSFRWHPYAVEPDVDYSLEPTTLVVFELKEEPDGVELTVTESGFQNIPLARRAKAFTANEQGWSMVAKLVEKYLFNEAYFEGHRRTEALGRPVCSPGRQDPFANSLPPS